MSEKYELIICNNVGEFLEMLPAGAGILIDADWEGADNLFGEIGEKISTLAPREICFSGRNAHELEDVTDEILEVVGALEIPTSAFISHQDACEHFLHAVGYQGGKLIALAKSDGQLIAALEFAMRVEDKS